MKTVTAGAHGVNNVVVDGSETVKFSFASTCLAMEVLEGEVTVALTDTAVAGDDETRTISEGTSGTFPHQRMGVDTYYLTGTGKVNLWASNKDDTNPFKGKSKGGDGGGDNTHYKGTTTTALENGSTTNPIVIDGESYTAVFGDVVVYGYTEFVFDGTAWSEFGRPFDTTPTSGSANAVTSDGIKTALDTKQNIMQYAVMPTITADMLGKIAMYVGATDANYTQGWFYIASSDGAAEPTYSWVHLPTQNGYSETMLWAWQSSSDSHADIILSASFLAFDALMLISNAKAFLEGDFAENDGEGYTATVPVSELVRHSGGTIVLGGSDVSGNSYVKYSFDTSSPTAITHKSHGSGTWAQTLRTVIGIKY